MLLSGFVSNSETTNHVSASTNPDPCCPRLIVVESIDSVVSRAEGIGHVRTPACRIITLGDGDRGGRVVRDRYLYIVPQRRKIYSACVESSDD